jgi:arylsulfatase A-like enzyme
MNDRAADVALIVLAILVMLAAGCARNQRPNLIIVLVDTLRADHVGYHGYARDTSPAIDALAASSIRFMNHYSHSSRTGPAVASIFTGLHPRSHGVVNPLSHFDAKGTLGDEQTTLAEILSENGYHCAGYVTNFNVSPRFGFAQGFDSYESIKPDAAAGFGRAEDVNAAAIETLREGDEPFFIYLHYMDPHSPYAAPPRYRFRYVDRNYDGEINGRHIQLDGIISGKVDVDGADRTHLAALYDQEIRYFDDEFDKLLGFLERQGLRDNTIIVFVADHGEELFDHGSVLHGYTLYEEQLRVPLFIHDPRADASRTVDAVTRHVDILPTLLELMNVSYPGALQGESLVPLVRGGETELPAAPVFAQASLRAVKTIQKRSFMVDGWKLIETLIPAPGEELYHVADDPVETRDLLVEDSEVASRLRARMRRFEESLPIGVGGVVELSDEDQARLRSMGYLE